MKKILAVLSSLALITAFSCNNKPADPPSVGYTAEKLSDVAAYRKTNLTIPESCFQIWSFMPYNNGNDFILLGSGLTVPAFWHTSDFNSYDTIEIPEFEIGVNYDIDCANDGTMVTFVTVGDQLPDEEGVYPDDTNYKFVINTYKDGKLVSSSDVEDFGVEASPRVSTNGVFSDGEIVIASISGSLEMFEVTGKYIGELTSEQYDIDAVGKSRDGSLICSAAVKKDDSDDMKICRINADGSLTDYNSAVYNFPETVQNIQAGSGDYDFFIRSLSTVFGIKAEGEIEPLFNINAAGLTSDALEGITLTENGNVAAFSNDVSTYSVVFREYIPRTAEEMEGIPVLTLGAVDGGDYVNRELVTKWNDEGHDFILQYKDYTSDIDERGNLVISGLQEDILTGGLPDIMYIGNNDARMLADSGSLCDLYLFIDSDETISRDTFVPNTLECFETDGKLYSLSDRFYLSPGRAAKTKFVGDGADWDIGDYVDVLTDPAYDFKMDSDSKESRRYYVLNETNWIDFQDAACHYKDDSFIKWLEWCNIPDVIEPDYRDISEYEQMSEEEMDAMIIEDNRRFIDDTAIFDSFWWGSYSSYVQDVRGKFNGEEITYLETPVLEASEKFAITSTCENKELAWEYIRSKLSDEYYTDPAGTTTWPFPVTKTGLEIYLEHERSSYIDYTEYEEITDPEWRDYRGVTYQLGSQIYGDNVMQLGEITDEDVKFVNDMIARAEPSETMSVTLDNDYYEIANEEILRFFNGETTAEECAEFMQDRVSTYLSERFG